MIQIRPNGKFFTESIIASGPTQAFELFIEGLKVHGIDDATATGLCKKGYKISLRPAGIEPLQFMWQQVLVAEQNDSHIVFCLFDQDGWKFFGRI